MKNEPLITRAVIVAAASAVIGLLVAFGVPLTDEQREAILTAVGIAAPIVVGVLARAHVIPARSEDADESDDAAA